MARPPISPAIVLMTARFMLDCGTALGGSRTWLASRMDLDCRVVSSMSCWARLICPMTPARCVSTSAAWLWLVRTLGGQRVVLVR